MPMKSKVFYPPRVGWTKWQIAAYINDRQDAPAKPLVPSAISDAHAQAFVDLLAAHKKECAAGAYRSSDVMYEVERRLIRHWCNKRNAA